MSEAYIRLADRLDQIPNGYPRTESGVELKLLAKLFNEEEAGIAASMSIDPLTAKEIAEINMLDEPAVKRLLIGMVKKGLIELRRAEGLGLVFKLIPFVVGFYERQNAKIDREFAELFEQYYRESFHKAMILEPSVHRIIPVEQTIPVDIDVMPYEKASTYLDRAKSWGVLDCICRVQQKLVGKGCEHPVENCLVFSTHPGAFDRTEDIKSISHEEALKILTEANEAGLVHSTNNAREDVEYICNCCTCSCGVLRGIAEHGASEAVARSDFYAQVDEQLCTGCGICIDRCQFNALEMEDVSVVDRNRCYGCGLCVTSCPDEAIRLILKDKTELIPPVLNDEAWRKKREKNRTW